MKAIAYIYFKESKICKVTYEEFDSTNFEFVFEPYYGIIDKLVGFRGIQGLDLNLRKKYYVRRNMIPTFIFEHNHLPGKKSFHTPQRVDDCSLLEYLSKSPLRYFGDKLYLKSE